MKKLIFLIPFFLNAGILSNTKQQEINFDTLRSIKQSDETKNSWINPVILQYSFQKDNILNQVTTTNLYSVSINQPIFKSGAIYYSIKYANLSKKYNLAQIKLQKRALIKQAFDLVYDYKMTQLNKKIIELTIENTKIDVERKKEAFLSGNGDSSLLDNVILALNNLKLSLEDIKTNMENIKYSFADLSDLKIDEVNLPKLKLIAKDKFLKNNIALNAQKKDKKIKNYLYKMQVGNQLLSVSLNGSYNYKEATNQITNKQNYYTMGISVTLPLDINAKSKIEEAKLDYLKSQVLIEDKTKELLNSYKMSIKKIESLKNKIKIYSDNIKIYDNLIKSTKEALSAGNATNLDLEILENSKEEAVLNQEIIKFQIQKELLNLYYQLSNFRVE